MSAHSRDHTSRVSAGAAHRGRLLWVLGIVTAVMVAEVVGSLLSGSLALLADAGHVLADVAGILLAVLAVTFAARPATPRHTFGWFRYEILAALVNAVLLMGFACYLLAQAWQRWADPPQVEGGLMLAFAAVGLVANLIGMALLRPGAQESLNVRGAYLEALGDLLGSGAVIIAAATIFVTGWERADVVASVAVATLILPRAGSLMRDAVEVLLEASPRGIDPDLLRGRILQVPHVIGVHDLHVWTLTSGMPVLSAHVVVSDEVLSVGDQEKVLDRLCDCLADQFAIEHCTFQLEPDGYAAHEFLTHD